MDINEKIKAEFLQIENRTDLTEDEKVEKVIKIGSAICAGVAVQPIPFADIFILTPLQAYMGTRIGAIRGFKVTETEAMDLLKQLAGVVGLGMAAQQIVLGLYKIGLPFFAGFTTIPLVFGLTYGIGKVMDAYFIHKRKGQMLDREKMKKIFEEARQESKKMDAKKQAKKFSGKGLWKNENHH